MAIADVTFHDLATPPKFAFGDNMGVWPLQSGESVQLDFSSGTDEIVMDASGPRLARVIGDADFRIALLTTGTATVANSMLVKANVEQAVFVPAGRLISVRAA